MEATETITTDIIPAPPKPVALVKPTTPRAIVMAEALKEDTEQRALLAVYVKEHMKEGLDYGVIPGTAKPTLLKPGAEKLTDLFRCTPAFEQVSKIEDWERGLFHYEFRCRITARDTGQVMAEGVGSANSREARYRWRNANRRCPQCEKETIFTSKNPGEGFFCWRKKGGCGATFEPTDERVTSQTEGRVENDDVFTLVNTILKMAKKRALVDGAIALARCSDIFTQDVEDMEPEHRQEPAPRAQPQTTPASQAHRPPAKALRVKKIIADAKAKGLDTQDRFDALVKASLGDVKPNGKWSDEDMAFIEGQLADPARVAEIIKSTDIPF